MAEYNDLINFDDDFENLDADPDSAEMDAQRVNAPDEPQGQRISDQELEQLRSYQRIVEQFNSNPMVAMKQMAEQMGYELRQQKAAEQANEQQQRIEQVEDLIDEPSMKFLAPMIAKVAAQIAEKKIKETIEPLQDNQRAIDARNRQSEYVSAAQKLSQRYPDWQSREKDMMARLEFIKSATNGGPLEHPQYGNVLETLYQLASAKNDARREVAQAYREAPLQRGVTSQDSTSRRPDIMKLVAKTKDPRDQIRIAFDEAVKEVIG